MPAALAALPFFVSVSTQQVSQNFGGFAAPIDTGVNRVVTDFTLWSQGSQHLNLLYSGQHVFNSRQGAMPTVAPSATTRGNDNFNQFQALWNQALRPATLLSASFGVVNAIVSSSFQNGVQGISTVDLPLLTFTGASDTSALRSGRSVGIRSNPMATMMKTPNTNCIITSRKSPRALTCGRPLLCPWAPRKG